MHLADIDRRVREANGRPIPLDTFPRVYQDETGVSLDPIGPEVPDPDDELVLYLLNRRHPGSWFGFPDEAPGFRLSDPVPDVIAHSRPGKSA